MKPPEWRFKGNIPDKTGQSAGKGRIMANQALNPISKQYFKTGGNGK